MLSLPHVKLHFLPTSVFGLACYLLPITSCWAGDNLEPIDLSNVIYLVNDSVPRRLGVFPPSGKAQVELVIPNSQNCDLEVVSTSKSCGCSKVTYSDTKCKANDNFAAAVDIDSSHVEGVRTIQVGIGFRSTSKDKLQLTEKSAPNYWANILLSIEVRKPVSWRPQPLRLALERGRAVTFSAVNYSPSRWQAAKVRSSDPEIELSAELKFSKVDGLDRDVVLVSATNRSVEHKRFNKQVDLDLLVSSDSTGTTWAKVDSVPLLVSQDDLFSVSPSQVYRTGRPVYRLFLAADFPEIDMADVKLSLIAKHKNVPTAGLRVISSRVISFDISGTDINQKGLNNIDLIVEAHDQEWKVSIPIH